MFEWSWFHREVQQNYIAVKYLPMFMKTWIRELTSDCHSIFKIPFSWDWSRILRVFLSNLCDDINIYQSFDFDNGMLLIDKFGKEREKDIFVFLKLSGWLSCTTTISIMWYPRRDVSKPLRHKIRLLMGPPQSEKSNTEVPFSFRVTFSSNKYGWPLDLA